MGAPQPQMREWATRQLAPVQSRPNPLMVATGRLTDEKREAGFIAERMAGEWIRSAGLECGQGDGIRVDLWVAGRSVSVKDRPTNGALRPDYMVAQPTVHVDCEEALFIAHFRRDDRYVILGAVPMETLKRDGERLEAGEPHPAFGGSPAGRDNYLFPIGALESPRAWLTRMGSVPTRGLEAVCSCGRSYIRGRPEWTTCLRCHLASWPRTTTTRQGGQRAASASP